MLSAAPGLPLAYVIAFRAGRVRDLLLRPQVILPFLAVVLIGPSHWKTDPLADAAAGWSARGSDGSAATSEGGVLCRPGGRSSAA